MSKQTRLRRDRGKIKRDAESVNRLSPMTGSDLPYGGISEKRRRFTAMGVFG
jgi:hypothetical protein